MNIYIPFASQRNYEKEENPNKIVTQKQIANRKFPTPRTLYSGRSFYPGFVRHEPSLAMLSSVVAGALYAPRSHHATSTNEKMANRQRIANPHTWSRIAFLNVRDAHAQSYHRFASS